MSAPGRPSLIEASERLSVFQKVADYVSEAMGRPANIVAWLVFVIGWTCLSAFGGPRLASGSWLPAWFASQGYNFPLNLVTTVAELFIGFLVAGRACKFTGIGNRTPVNLRASGQRGSTA
jgi:hypothetical protein